MDAPTAEAAFDQERYDAGRYDGVLEIIDRNHGDLKMMWDKNNTDEVATVRAAFDEGRKKGMLAYSVTSEKGSKGDKITSFDPTAERVILSPQLVGG